MRRLVVVILVVALAATTVAAVFSALRSGGDAAPPAGPTTTLPTTTAPAEPGSGEPPAPDLGRFYRQDVRWEPCRDEFLCGTVTVPLDYARPEGRTIDLALLKVPAAAPRGRPGTLLVNPGGPGAPGTEYAAQAALVFREPLRDQLDIVGFDPRGTGASSPVDCLTDAQLDDYVASDPDPDDAAERRDYADWVEAFGRGCAARSGRLAAHVSTIEAARDLDVIRAALGRARLTYFGASYGTELGATYAELFPRKVGRLVLDGAVDVSLGSRAASRQQAAGFETALRAYVSDCVDSGGCVLGDSLDEGLDRITGLVDQIDATPLPTSSGRDLEVGNAFYGIVAPLYNSDYWYVLTTALEQALDGDGTTLLALSDVYTSRGEDGYTDNSAEAIYAINCLDDPYAIDQSEVPAALPVFERASPTFGSVFAWGLTGCGGIRVESSQEPLDIRAEGAAPILVVGTTRDPATPYRWAKALAAQLESGVLLSRDGDGHTGYNSGNDCVDEAVEAYLLRGEVPRDGTRC